MGLGTAITSFTRALRDPEVTSLNLRSALDNPAIPLASPAAFAIALGTGTPTASGEQVTEHTALTVNTVFSCVRLIAEAIGTMPMKVYHADDNSKTVVVKDHSLNYLFKHQASPDHTPSVLFETLAFNLALTGNGYLEIERGANGIVSALYPLPSSVTSPIRLPNGSLSYRTASGMAHGQTRDIPQANVIHVPLFSEDGLKGISPISKGREVLGLDQAQLKMAARFFGNGSHAGGILSPKTGTLSPAQGQQLREFWEQQAAGINQGRVAVLPAELVYQSVGMSMEDSQFLASRAHSRADIAAMFRIAAHMVGDTSHTNTKFEDSALSLQQDTLQPYIVKIEQEFQRKLLPATGQLVSRYELRFDLSERLRTDRKTLLDSVALARQNGLYSINDGRKELGLDPIGPEGDIFSQATNTINAKLFADWNPQKTSGTGDPLKMNESKSVTTVSPAVYQPLVRDAIGRIQSRANRTSETFSTILSPVYTSIAEQLLQEARGTFDLPSMWLPATEKLLKDCFSATEHRSKAWSSANLSETAATETERVYRTLRLNIYREAGAAVASKE